MGIIELCLIALSLAMDAFAVSVCRGLEMKKIRVGECFRMAIAFGLFQAIMPIIGYMLGHSFLKYIESFDHWVAFVLLAFIGGKMIYDSIKNRNVKDPALEGATEDSPEEREYEKLEHKELLIMAVATSIDALAVGVTFAIMPNVNLAFSVCVIGVITLVVSFIGCVIGSKVGSKLENKAQLCGGIVLVLIGIKILLEGYGIISF